MSKTPGLEDESYYERVLAELRRGERREGLWAKALTEAINDSDLAQSLYMKWRVKQLLDEDARVSEQQHEGARRARQDKSGNRRTGAPIGTVVLWLFVAWFAYDGWVNQDPEMQKHILFNRVFAVMLSIWASISTYRFLRKNGLVAKAPSSN